jgi:hypothetical protein
MKRTYPQTWCADEADRTSLSSGHAFPMKRTWCADEADVCREEVELVEHSEFIELHVRSTCAGMPILCLSFSKGSALAATPQSHGSALEPTRYGSMGEHGAGGGMSGRTPRWKGARVERELVRSTALPGSTPSGCRSRESQTGALAATSSSRAGALRGGRATDERHD